MWHVISIPRSFKKCTIYKNSLKLVTLILYIFFKEKRYSLLFKGERYSLLPYHSDAYNPLQINKYSIFWQFFHSDNVTINIDKYIHFKSIETIINIFFDETVSIEIVTLSP